MNTENVFPFISVENKKLISIIRAASIPVIPIRIYVTEVDFLYRAMPRHTLAKILETNQFKLHFGLDSSPEEEMEYLVIIFSKPLLLLPEKISYTEISVFLPELNFKEISSRLF